MTVTTEENVERVKELYEAEPSTSIRRGAQQLGLSRESFRVIARDTACLYPYKIQIYQQLTDRDAERRLNFGNEMLEQIRLKNVNIEKTYFTDEAHFHLNGYVNKQNWRHWGTQNPHLAVAQVAHPQRLTVWCALTSSTIIGPFFIEGTVTGEKYVYMLTIQFLPKIRQLRMVRGYWFQYDGARPHRTEEALTLLSRTFQGQLIGLDSPKFSGVGIEWPPYSPDLSPCDFFLWAISRTVFTGQLHKH